MKLTAKASKSIASFYGLSAVLLFIEKEATQPPEIETAIVTAAKMTGYELSDLSYKSLYSLNVHIQNNRDLIDMEHRHQVIFESAKEGILSIRTRWTDYAYEGYVVSTDKVCTICVNGNDFETRAYDDACIQAIENVKVLLEETGKTRVDSCDKIRALFEVFKSPKNTNHLAVHTKLQKLVNQICEKEMSEMSGKKARSFQNEKCNWIINKYLSYLWDKAEQQTPIEFISGFDSFINKNKELWRDGFEDRTEQLNLYTESHKSIISTFMQEESAKYLVSLYNEKEIQTPTKVC